jgi:hypothetical protein
MKRRSRMRSGWLVVVAVAVSGTAAAEVAVQPCRLLGKAEVRAALGAPVTRVAPGLPEDGEGAIASSPSSGAA